MLDSGDTVFLPRREIEVLRAQAGGVQKRCYVQAQRTLTDTEANAVRESVKRWQDDPAEVLILPPGVSVRTADAGDERWVCDAAKDLPVDTDSDWSGDEATAAIFAHAGGDDFDPTIARKGFLACDMSAPHLRGSYKLPFCHVHGGVLTASAAGIRAAASRLPQTDIPDGVKADARAVLDHYEGLMKAAPDDRVTRAGRRISAANKAMLMRALDSHQAALGAAAEHHATMTACIESVMGSDDDDPDDDADDGAMALPPGAVVPEADESLTPEERRLKEARALRDSLKTDDD